MQLRRWYFFRIFLGLASIWFGFVLYPIFSSMSLNISPLDSVRNGNIIVFVTVLSSASLGLFLETKRAFTWNLSTYHFIGLLLILLVSAIHIPLFTLDQAKTSPKTVVFLVSIILLVATIWLARNNYLMSLLDQEPLNEEEEREAEDSYEKAKKTTEAGDVKV